MNALTLLNNFEREFSRPFFHSPLRQAWFGELVETRQNWLNSELLFDEKSETWNLTVEMPGVTKDQVKIDLAEQVLTVSGEKTKGFNRGKFEGRYNIPEGIDAEKISASFEDGILTVALPLSEKKLARTIQIK